MNEIEITRIRTQPRYKHDMHEMAKRSSGRISPAHSPASQEIHLTDILLTMLCIIVKRFSGEPA